MHTHTLSLSHSCQCLVVLCCVDKLDDSECFTMHNVWRHAHYTGYSDTFLYAGPLPHAATVNIIAIDALTSNHFARSERDLRKVSLPWDRVIASACT